MRKEFKVQGRKIGNNMRTFTWEQTRFADTREAWEILGEDTMLKLIHYAHDLHTKAEAKRKSEHGWIKGEVEVKPTK